MYSEDEYLMISGLQHFVFCRRQWALIHIEQQWAENYRTADGQVMHRNVHAADFHEKRGDTVISRAMAVSSSRLGLSGECDAVEFIRDSGGINIFGLEGRYRVIPVEYKRGSPKADECDIMQLAAQAMCLEEMLCCEIQVGYLFYGEIRRRQKVLIDEDLRKRTEKAILEMHDMYSRRYTPKVKRNRSCSACSLKDVCLPMLLSAGSARSYVKDMLDGDDQY